MTGETLCFDWGFSSPLTLVRLEGDPAMSCGGEDPWQGWPQLGYLEEDDEG